MPSNLLHKPSSARLNYVADSLLNPVYHLYGNWLRKRLSPGALPQHVAVLADGNRRWARANAPEAPLVIGYQAGATKLREFVSWCQELGISTVTLWVLSTENLQRAATDELAPLLDVITNLVRKLTTDSSLKVQVVGDLTLLSSDAAAALKAAESASTPHNPSTQVNVAVAYGGRHELRDAVRTLLAAEAVKGNTLSQLATTLETDQIAAHLYTAGQPDPDLIIRSSGEQRLSGFLMWQSAHSEFYFCEALWPDFRYIDFLRALRAYAQRERRYGR
ncbi:MAG: di-trans,poly-cis-decaprenylcistransferase [Propionibacteriaceae bacterium]|jgi:short-chain Z-isoprenyl diphosphate synthase|nr:di-trans,poly-cis-decaprenylcistransferase [Propionibacteriaceae bacterium]